MAMKASKVEEKPNDDAVPGSYVCSDLEKPLSSNLLPSMLSQIPVINMEILLANNASHSWDRELEKLHLACKDWGFFQIINHGVSSSLLEKVKSEVQVFFNLPLEEKKKFDAQNYGKMEGYWQITVDEHSSWVDKTSMLVLPTHLRNPHLFPNFPLSVRDTLEEYIAQLKELSKKILNIMGKALGVEAEELSAVFEEGVQTMNMYRYPTCPKAGVVMGLSPHTDVAGLTILFQANQVEGLHVKKDGAWIPVTPLPNAFVINVGDMIEVVTNGIYKGVEHRPVFNANKERFSIATFFSPKRDWNLSPAQSLIDLQNPSNFKYIGTVRDYLNGYFDHRLVGKSYLDTLRMETKVQQNN